MPDLARVIVPVGGGGLASGIGIALRRERPDVELIGVQASACAPFAARARAAPARRAECAAGARRSPTASRSSAPASSRCRCCASCCDRLETVSEDEIADAMVFLAERAKLVAEGAGAVAVAALLSGRLRAASTGTTVAIVSGGNVDSGLLASLLRRHETEAGPARARVHARARPPRRPRRAAQR